MALIGVVLAGGAGRRLGRTKGDIVLDGKTLAERAARALSPLVGSVLVSVAPGARPPAHGFPVLEDAAPGGRGPLAGIHTAFQATGRSDLLVLACDYPRVDTPLLRGIVELAWKDDDLVFPVDPRGRDHPLVGLWRRRCEQEVAAALANRVYKVRALLAGVRARRLGQDDLEEFDLMHALANLNTVADLDGLGGTLDV